MKTAHTTKENGSGKNAMEEESKIGTPVKSTKASGKTTKLKDMAA